jgi:hypothetical protein
MNEIADFIMGAALILAVWVAQLFDVFQQGA